VPEQPKSPTVPPYERVRSHHDEELSPIDQSREQDECDSGSIVQASRLDLSLDIERQLLAQEGVFDCEAIMG
jgi:hypothetical protein